MVPAISHKGIIRYFFTKLPRRETFNFRPWRHYTDARYWREIHIPVTLFLNLCDYFFENRPTWHHMLFKNQKRACGLINKFLNSTPLNLISLNLRGLDFFFLKLLWYNENFDIIKILLIRLEFMVFIDRLSP